MNIIEHQLHLLTPTGVPLTILNDGAFAGLNYGLRDLEPGVLELVLPGDFGMARLAIDSQIEIYRAVGYGAMQLEGDTSFFIRRVQPSTRGDGVKVLHVTAYSAISLLARRIVAYASGTSYTDSVSMPWDNLIRSIVRENFGLLATDTDRNLSPWMTVQADTSWGANKTESFPWQIVMNVLSGIVNEVRGNGFYCTFDVIRTAPSVFEFRVFLGPRGIDHSSTGTNPVIVSEERHNLLEPSLDFDWTNEKNYIYATGQGSGLARVVKTAQDDTRIGVSPFNRIEFNQDARNASLDASVQAKADYALQDHRPKRTFTGSISQTDGCLYGVHWKWGDIVTAEYDGYTFDCHVDAVTVTIAPNGTEIATGILRSVSDVI